MTGNMSNRGSNTYREIMSQPQVWAEAIDVFRSKAQALSQLWNRNPAEQVIFSGCGSTYYLSVTAAAIFQYLTGVPAQSFPASELVLFPDRVYLKDMSTLLVAVSRSGETTETIKAVPIFRKKTGGRVIAITCDSNNTLTKQADLSLAVDAAQEESIAQTRSFASMLILAQALAKHLGGKDFDYFPSLPSIGERLLSDYEEIARKLGEDKKYEKFFFLGSGMLNGVANEAMLKMKEMSLTYSEAFHTLEFRHGPMSIVDEQTLVVGLISENATSQEVAVLRDMRELGAGILAIMESSNDEITSLGEVVQLETKLPAWARPVTYLPILQLMAYYRSLAKGLDPDHPTNLAHVVHLDSLTSDGQ